MNKPRFVGYTDWITVWFSAYDNYDGDVTPPEYEAEDEAETKQIMSSVITDIFADLCKQKIIGAPGLCTAFHQNKIREGSNSYNKSALTALVG